MTQTRPTFVEGLFYPGREKVLKSSIEEYLEGPSVLTPDESPLALIVPHAGYLYSGAVAGLAYRELRGRSVGTAILVAPSHHAVFQGVTIFPGQAYETPFGRAPIDRTMRDQLVEAGSDLPIRLSTEGHGREHAIEVQLPFLTHLFPGLSILPLVMGRQTEELCTALGDLLAACCSTDTILIASSDLSHYHSSATAEILDARVEDSVRRLDTNALLRDLSTGEAEACGGGPIAAVMRAAVNRGAKGVHVLRRCTSAWISRDAEKVVGYLSAVLYRHA